MNGDVEGMLHDIDDEIERELDNQARLLEQAQAHESQIAETHRAAPPDAGPCSEPDAHHIYRVRESTPEEPHLLHQVWREVQRTQQQLEALHHAWLAQARLLERSTFPTRWVMVVLAAMILTWVFSGFRLAWGS